MARASKYISSHPLGSADRLEQLKEKQFLSQTRMRDMMRDRSGSEELLDLGEQQQCVDSMSKKLVKLKSS